MKQNIRNSTRLKSRRRFDDVLTDTWWLRSTFAKYCDEVGFVYHNGNVNTYYSTLLASYSYGVLLACVI